MSHSNLPRQNDLETTFYHIVEHCQLKQEKENCYRGSCPAHESKSGDGFVVTLEPERILLHCHGSCSFEEMVAALGYKPSDMNVQDHNPKSDGKSTSRPKPPQPRVMSENGKTGTDFEYDNENDKVVYRVRRTDFADERPKEIRPYTQIDGRWIQGLDEKFRRYPYNLRCLLDAIKRGEIIFFPEGEQKTQRLIDAGVNATCIAGGAKAWPKYRYDYMHYFQGARVVLLPDHDESGYKFVETVRADLKTVCKDVVIVPLPGLKEPKEDIVEWLDKYGHTVEELAELAHAAFERASGRKRVVSETALDLWHAKLEPREDLIEEFVTEGTHLIASKKGVGKTHLLFNIAVSVATGAYALSKFPTVQSGVLCYFLDDPRSRIKLRLHDMLADTIGADSDPDPSLANLTIKYEVPSPRSAKAFLDDVQAHLDAHPNTKLIIVDMLGRIKPPARGNANLYQDDNDFMTEVRQFMAERRLTCLISHHVRKASADDIYETINGTTGLIGAVDGVFILESQRGSNTAILHAMGNDIEEREIGLKFDPARMSWDVADVSDVKTPARGPLDSAQSPCREWLKKILSTGAMTPDEVKKQGKANGFSRSTVYRAIKKMDIRTFDQKEEGRLVTYWTLPVNDVFPTYQKPEIPGIGEIPEKPGIPETQAVLRRMSACLKYRTTLRQP